MNKDLKEIFEIIDTLENSVRKLVIENENLKMKVRELEANNG